MALLLMMLSGSRPAVAAPRACQPGSGQLTQLDEAQRVFSGRDPGGAAALWDSLLQAPAGDPPCRTVEIAWRIGEFLKVRQESPELALRYVNRGIAAYRKGGPEDDLVLGKLLKTAGHFFKRQHDRARACQSLDAAQRVLVALDEQAPARVQTRAQMADLGCAATGSPAAASR